MGIFSITKTPNNILDNVLYEVPGTDTDITFADALEGTLILGATGSGKTSGPGRHIALSMLKKGFSMCVLCAKKEEKDRWLNYAKEAGRLDDIVTFDKASNLQFNFLDYEMQREGEGGGDVLNVSNMLVNLNEQIRIIQSGSSRSDEKFWDNALRRLISRTISLLKYAGQNIDIYNIRKVITDSLTSEDIQVYNLIKDKATTHEKIPNRQRQEAQEDLQAMIDSNYFVKLLEITHALQITDELSITIGYWKHEFANLSERTRSVIIESTLGIIEPFLLDGVLKRQFAKGLSSELLPENIIEHKKIVLVDFSVKEFGLSGILASAIYKITFQAAMERRDIDSETDPKPCGLWIDEYQMFCYPSIDALFQSTARSSWVATVYITQNLNGIYQVMGNNQPQSRTKALLGNINLKYFASNADYDTNRWASDMIGEHWVEIDTLNYNDKAELHNKTKRPERRRKVEIDEFTTLKTGRKTNRHIVEAIVFKAGKTWGDDNDNYALAKFKQK